MMQKNDGWIFQEKRDQIGTEFQLPLANLMKGIIITKYPFRAGGALG